jgi:hypothetical protein
MDAGSCAEMWWGWGEHIFFSSSSTQWSPFRFCVRVVVLGRAGTGMATVWHIKVFGHECQDGGGMFSRWKVVEERERLMDVLLSPANENDSDASLLLLACTSARSLDLRSRSLLGSDRDQRRHCTPPRVLAVACWDRRASLLVSPGSPGGRSSV